MAMERRQLYRLELVTPICGEITINTIEGKRVDVKSTNACVINISAGGMCVQTALRLPKDPRVLYKLSTRILGKDIVVYGTFVWSKTADGLYQYGFKYDFSEFSQDSAFLSSAVNQLAVRQRRASSIENSAAVCKRSSPKCNCSIKKVLETAAPQEAQKSWSR